MNRKADSKLILRRGKLFLAAGDDVDMGSSNGGEDGADCLTDARGAASAEKFFSRGMGPGKVFQ